MFTREQREPPGGFRVGTEVPSTCKDEQEPGSSLGNAVLELGMSKVHQKCSQKTRQLIVT